MPVKKTLNKQLILINFKNASYLSACMLYMKTQKNGEIHHFFAILLKKVFGYFLQRLD